MSHKFDSIMDSSFEDSDHSVVAKLRRLKIQEGFLLKNINKISAKDLDGEVGLPTFYSVELNHLAKKVKDSFSEINLKFEDIKAEAEEKLSCLDIETMKRDVLKLDEKLRTFKNYLQSELSSTISKEAELTKEVNKIEERPMNIILKAKSRTKLFNHIVPSPVKVLIKSPFKCKEVQDLQEFMMNSANRFGGWNEYNHNIFVQVWQKHFDTKHEFNKNKLDSTVENNEAFVKETMQKIAGSTRENIISHRNWYSQYLYLKEQQQNALNKWRKNQRILTKTNNIKRQEDEKGTLDKTKPVLSNNFQTLDLTNNMDENNDEQEILSAPHNMSLKNEDLAYRSEMDMNNAAGSNISEDNNSVRRPLSCILKPTIQWTNRCNSLRDSVKNFNNIETIRKLRVPDWRLTLQD